MDAVTSVYTVSLIAAFIAGMVALFAPCCISYLLPAYLANIFKERKQILGMTFVYSLGIFTVMFPVVLGAKILSDLLFDLHDKLYIGGGLFMILVSVIALMGYKLPMPHFSVKTKQNDVWSTYVLGVVSGLTSACCAPVLLGAMTLSALSPSFYQAILVGGMYVLGMVTPLYLSALLIHKRNLLQKPLLRKKITALSIGRKEYPILVSNLAAFVLFFLTGWLLILLTLSGKLSMGEREMEAVKTVSAVALFITEKTEKIPFANQIFLIALTFLGVGIFRSLKNPPTGSSHHDCCQSTKKPH